MDFLGENTFLKADKILNEKAVISMFRREAQS